MIHTLFLIVSFFAAAAAQIFPITYPLSVPQYFLAKVYDSYGSGDYILTKNYTSNVLNILQCQNASYSIPCNLVSELNPQNISYILNGYNTIYLNSSNIKNFGNKVAINYPIFAISFDIGKLFVGAFTYGDITFSYYLPNNPVLSTGGNSDPTSIISDNTLGIFYVSYNNINYNNYNGPGIVVIRNIYNGILEYITTFDQDILYYENSNYIYNNMRDIKLTTSVGYLFVGFPHANNGIGLVMIYDCYYSPCVYQTTINNPVDSRRFNFGSAISVSFNNYTSFYLTVGVSQYKTSSNEQNYTNLNTGSSYIYYCSLINDTSIHYRGFILDCATNLYQYTYSDFIGASCASLSQNFGQYVQITSDTFAGITYTLISSPANCDGRGTIWLYINYLNNITAPQLINTYTLSEFYYGDGLGLDLFYNTQLSGIYDATVAYANTNQEGYFIILPDYPYGVSSRSKFLSKKPTSYKSQAIWSKMKKAPPPLPSTARSNSNLSSSHREIPRIKAPGTH